MNKLILQKDANPNYLATICKITNLEKIEDSDHLCKINVNGYTIVASNDITIGDIIVFIPVECAVSSKYLSANNLYSIDNYFLNNNINEVKELLNKAETNSQLKKDFLDNAKSKVGFFDKKGRVRIIKLRGVYSEGFIAKVNTLEKYDKSLIGTNWENLIGTKFNFVGNDEFCKKYIVAEKESVQQINSDNKGFFKKRQKTLKRFDRIVPGTFFFHYDTVKLNETIGQLSPSDVVTISVKVHGTSAIFAHVPVKRKISFLERILKLFGKRIKEVEYGDVYSSRSVIKNKYITDQNKNSFYESNVWKEVDKLISPFIDKGMTVYGEIVGYLPNSNTMIQKDHDYGCKEGKWKFMPYRITMLCDDEVKEWNLMDVDAWTRNLVKEHPSIENNIMQLTILYHGTLGDLYPDLLKNNSEEYDWHQALLERLKNDKETFLMEEKEPLCHLYEKESDDAKAKLDEAIKNKKSKSEIKELKNNYEKIYTKRAPREGIVIRIDDDKFKRAWKLKTDAHFHRECIEHDNGDVDIEDNS